MFASLVELKTFLTMRRADLQYNLMMIQHNRAILMQYAGNETTDLMEEFTRRYIRVTGQDESSGAVDVMSNTSYNAMYNSIQMRYQAKEQQLELQQKQLETQLAATTTEIESVDSAIDNAAKNEYGIFK